MAIQALAPLLASLLGTETAAAAAGAAGTASANAAASSAGQSFFNSVTQAIVGSGLAGASGGAGGPGGAGGAGGSGGAGGGGGLGGSGGAGGAGGGSVPPIGPGGFGGSDEMGDFHRNLLNSIRGLEDFHDSLQLAGSAATQFSSGEIDVLKKPISAVLGTFETQIDQAVSGKGLPTAGLQRGVDSAWKLSGGEFVSSIPIIGTMPSIFKDVVDAAINLPNAIEQWAEALLSSRFELARWNSSIAGTKVEAERREILRDIASGNATSASTEALNNSLQDLKDTMRPINDTLINGFNRILTHLVKTTDTGLKIAGFASEIYLNLQRFNPIMAPLAAVLLEVKRILGLPGAAPGTVWQTFMDKTANPPKNPPPGNNGP